MGHGSSLPANLYRWSRVSGLDNQGPIAKNPVKDAKSRSRIFYTMEQLISFFNVVLFLVVMGGAIPVTIGVWYYHHLSKASRLVWWVMVISLSCNILQIILRSYHIPNLFVGHLYTMAEFSLIAYVYHMEFRKFLPARFMLWLIGLFIGFSIVNILFIEGFYSNNSYQKTLESVLLILITLLYFYKTAKELKVARIEQAPLFWLSTGVLTYFCGSLFIFIFSNYLLTYSQELGIKIWAIHAFFLLLFYLANSIALWVDRKK